MIAVNEVDVAVWRWMIEHRSSGATAFFRALTTLCNPLTVVVITAVVGGGLLIARRRELTVRLVASVAGAWATATVLKLVVTRQRPPVAERLITVAEFSFPSGHATQSVALWSSLALVGLALAPPPVRRRLRWVAGAGAMVIAALVGLSRLYLGVHWLTDVVAGWAVGAAWCWGSWRGVDLVRKPSPARLPVGADHVAQPEDGAGVAGGQRGARETFD